MTRLYYCGGYGGVHIIPGNTGRHWFACGRCRWGGGRDSDEHKQKVLDSIAGRASTYVADDAPPAPRRRPQVQAPLF